MPGTGSHPRDPQQDFVAADGGFVFQALHRDGPDGAAECIGSVAIHGDVVPLCRSLPVASENSIHWIRHFERIRTRLPDDRNRLPFRAGSVQLLQIATAA